MYKTLFILSTLLLLSFSESNLFLEEQDQVIELKNGQWMNIHDTLWGVEILDSSFIMYERPYTASANDTYSYQVTTELEEYADTETKPGNFLILTQRKMKLEYEIMGYDDSTFSILHFPSGSLFVFEPERILKK